MGLMGLLGAQWLATPPTTLSRWVERGNSPAEIRRQSNGRGSSLNRSNCQPLTANRKPLTANPTRDGRIAGSESFVGVFIGNHCFDRGKDGLGAVNATEESSVFDRAPEEKGWALINPQQVKFGGARLDRIQRLFIIDRAGQFGLTDASGLGGELNGDFPLQDRFTLQQTFGFEHFPHRIAMAKILGRLDDRIRHPGCLSLFFDPIMIEPAPGRYFAAVIVPFLLLKPAIHRFTVVA